MPGAFTAANDPNSLGGLQSFAVTTAVIPEPATIVLGLMGGLGLLLRRRK
ncbi:MAG: PEP-CTERM sorting domain-containing protein [Pedosphaera parvula]|nr:PEP-CTERM sorting domain-containing protein [Pedosphaera parvula]